MDNFVLSINGDIPRSTVRMYKNNENVKKKDDFCWQKPLQQELGSFKTCWL